MKRVAVLALMIPTICLASVKMKATANETTGSSHQTTYVNTGHEFHIINDSDQPLTYTLYIRACIIGHGCTDRQWDEKIAAHGKLDKDYPIQHSANIKNVGTYTVTSTTATIGREAATVMANGSVWIPN